MDGRLEEAIEGMSIWVYLRIRVAHDYVRIIVDYKAILESQPSNNERARGARCITTVPTPLVRRRFVSLPEPARLAARSLLLPRLVLASTSVLAPTIPLLPLFFVTTAVKAERTANTLGRRGEG